MGDPWRKKVRENGDWGRLFSVPGFAVEKRFEPESIRTIMRLREIPRDFQPSCHMQIVVKEMTVQYRVHTQPYGDTA